MCVNNLPKVATQWKSGATRDSNRGRRVLIPSAPTTTPLSHSSSSSNSGNSGSGSQWEMATDVCFSLSHPLSFPWIYVRFLRVKFCATEYAIAHRFNVEKFKKKFGTPWHPISLGTFGALILRPSALDVAPALR